MGGIFVSYRREDSPGESGRIYDHLTNRFGDDQVFRDIDAIDIGADFVEAINNAISACDVVLIIIGREWNPSTNDKGQRRLDNPEDFVRLEIAAALSRDIRIIPVLVQGASMPRPEELPPDIARLTRRNAIELSDSRFRFDIDRLISSIERTLAEAKKDKVEPRATWWMKLAEKKKLVEKKKSPLVGPDVLAERMRSEARSRQPYSEDDHPDTTRDSRSRVGGLKPPPTRSLFRWIVAALAVLGILSAPLLQRLSGSSSPPVTGSGSRAPHPAAPRDSPPATGGSGPSTGSTKSNDAKSGRSSGTPFEIGSSGRTVLDTRTHLMWTRHDFGTLENRYVKNWDEAMAWAARMNEKRYGGHNDWRVPTIAEYRTLSRSDRDRALYERVFEDAGADFFWSSNELSQSIASYISFESHFAASGDKNEKEAPGKYSVRLVRSAK